ncbi:flagellin [Thalassotalea euphylliae]|uniref:Flagellin n=1 Tax=Thalassotalea euphylliae TaxID=1655234 RepID=A0A3E0TRK6_9GAMM|nr:flagellin [Thalassotalea euphylliae]REL26612.1 flagellin [Thalassotalea euphylliae]
MPLYLNTNIGSINAQKQLSNISTQLNTSFERLSSGLRINNAKDDAAGLQISNRLTAQIMGLAQANRNANNGISVAQTAEGALGKASEVIQRLRVLALQSANGSNTSNDRVALDDEYQLLIQEINSIADKTSFAGKPLLDGSFDELFQVGANASQTVPLQIDGFSADDIGSAKAVTKTTLIQDVEQGSLRLHSNPIRGFGDPTSHVLVDSSAPPSVSWPSSTAVSTVSNSGSTFSVPTTGSANAKEVAENINNAGLGVTASAATYASLVFRDFPNPAFNTVPYPTPIDISFDVIGELGSVSVAVNWFN